VCSYAKSCELCIYDRFITIIIVESGNIITKSNESGSGKKENKGVFAMDNKVSSVEEYLEAAMNEAAQLIRRAKDRKGFE
jgi:hypothetical protein